MTDLGLMDLEGGESRLHDKVRNNPFPFYRSLRKQDPVYYDPGLDLYLVTRYEDCVTVLQDDVTFSLEHGYQDRYGGENLAEFIEIMERDGGGFIRDLAIDPPGHTRLRKLTEKAFTAHRVKDLEPRIRQIVVDLIEGVADKGSADGILDIGGPLTAHIICEQLGFDWSEVGHAKVAVWTKAVLDQIGRMQDRETMLENAKVMCELQNFIGRYVDMRAAEPREDMISDLVHAVSDDGENLLFVLATTPGLADELYPHVENERTMMRFVEEMLRLQPPVHGLFRTAMKDTVLGGAKVPAMAQLCILYASANDDDSHFSDPRKLDIERPNLGSHITFGSGIHRCVGVALARMEIKVAAQEVIRRLKNIELAMPVENLTYQPTLASHTPERLPLTFKRRPN
jgi:cytochrome P450